MKRQLGTFISFQAYKNTHCDMECERLYGYHRGPKIPIPLAVLLSLNDLGLSRHAM